MNSLTVVLVNTQNQTVIGLQISNAINYHPPVSTTSVVSKPSSRTMKPLTHTKVCAIVSDYRTSGNALATARKHNVDRKSVHKYDKMLKTNKNIIRKKSTGRPKAMSDEACKLAESLLLNGEVGGLKQVANELQQQLGLHISTKTLSQSVKRFCSHEGRPIKAGFKKPNKQLSMATREKRISFCTKNKTRNWSNVMFTDRCKFHFYYPGVKLHSCAWVRVGHDREAPKVNHASCLNVYAGITKFGVTSMVVVAGTTKHKTTFKNKKGADAKNITGGEYKHVVLQLLAEGKRIYGDKRVGVMHWYLQQDNDPTHKKASRAALGEWRASNPDCVVDILPDWPPNSPDLSPIENVWSYVQQQANKAGCKTFDEFSATVQSTFASLSKSYINNLFDSMKNRVEQCLERKGGKTKY